MSRATPRDIRDAVRQANRSGIPKAPETSVAPGAEAGHESPKRRRYREGLRGVLFYLSPNERRTLKLMAVSEGISLQDLCTRTMREKVKRMRGRTIRTT